MLAGLATIDPAQLSTLDQVRYGTVKYAASAGNEGTRFFYGQARCAFEFYSPAPYPVSQQDGALLRIPEFLDSQHPIANAADAEAYLARVAALAHLLDQESGRIAYLASRNVMPPSFIAANALGQLRGYRGKPVAEQKLVTSLVTRTKALGIQGDWDTRVSKLVQTQVYPALDRQIAAFAKATAHAPDTAGVYRLPDGEAYYRWALKLSTTTDLSAAEIHAIGLEQNEALKARMDTILRSQGMTQGSPGDRVQSLNSDPRQIFPDTDQGREAVLDYCDDRLAALRALRPKYSHYAARRTAGFQASA